MDVSAREVTFMLIVGHRLMKMTGNIAKLDNGGTGCLSTVQLLVMTDMH